MTRSRSSSENDSPALPGQMLRFGLRGAQPSSFQDFNPLTGKHHHDDPLELAFDPQLRISVPICLDMWQATFDCDDEPAIAVGFRCYRLIGSPCNALRQ